jgi:hypothetical protein
MTDRKTLPKTSTKNQPRKKAVARSASTDVKVGKQLAVPTDGLTPLGFAAKLADLSLDEEALEGMVSLGRGMFGVSPGRLSIGTYMKGVVTATTHLPQFRVSSNPAQGILGGNGGTGIPTTWSYVQLIWNAFYTKTLTVDMLTNPSTLSSAATDFYVGVLYQGLAADTQSTTLLTAFAAGVSAKNKKLLRGASGNASVEKSSWRLVCKNPFPYAADSSGWQLTPTTSEIFQASFTTNLATTTDGDCYCYVMATWDVMLKYQAPSS